MMPFLPLLAIAIVCCTWGAFLRYISSDRAATRRWKRINAEQPQVCECGQPGVVQQFMPYPVRGSVQPFWWRCEEHSSVPSSVPWSNGVPQWNQRPSQCSWHSSKIKTGLITECGCGTHVGTLASEKRWPGQ